VRTRDMPEPVPERPRSMKRFGDGEREEIERLRIDADRLLEQVQEKHQDLARAVLEMGVLEMGVQREVADRLRTLLEMGVQREVADRLVATDASTLGGGQEGPGEGEGQDRPGQEGEGRGQEVSGQDRP
jgi:hypothetical protein